tara:strand:+ start:1367 stop:1510 length:144 start_codon:yes stop_codon:yes gene_type:complete
VQALGTYVGFDPYSLMSLETYYRHGKFDLKRVEIQQKMTNENPNPIL